MKFAVGQRRLRRGRRLQSVICDSVSKISQFHFFRDCMVGFLSIIMCRDFENKLGFRRKLFGKVGRSRRDRRRVGLAYLFSGESLIVRFLGHVFFHEKTQGHYDRRAN